MVAGEVFKTIESNFPDGVKSIDIEGFDPSATIEASSLLEICSFLKSDKKLKFTSLMCLSGVDYEEKMEIVYHLHSLHHNHKVALKVELPREKPVLPSVVSIWTGADWHEREAFDLYGIHFEDHPNLKRILLPDDWEGYPLRKDHVDADKYRGWTIRKVKEGYE